MFIFRMGHVRDAALFGCPSVQTPPSGDGSRLIKNLRPDWCTRETPSHKEREKVALSALNLLCSQCFTCTCMNKQIKLDLRTDFSFFLLLPSF